MRALPGPGFGVGSDWTVGGEEVEVTMRARWVWGMLWVAMTVWIGVWRFGGGRWFRACVREIGALGWDQDRGGRLYIYGIKTEEGICICTLCPKSGDNRGNLLNPSDY